MNRQTRTLRLAQCTSCTVPSADIHWAITEKNGPSEKLLLIQNVCIVYWRELKRLNPKSLRLRYNLKVLLHCDLLVYCAILYELSDASITIPIQSKSFSVGKMHTMLWCLCWGGWQEFLWLRCRLRSDFLSKEHIGMSQTRKILPEKCSELSHPVFAFSFVGIHSYATECLCCRWFQCVLVASIVQLLTP